jgi:SAM-dependent methyltransferase
MSEPHSPTQVLDWEQQYQTGRTGWERGAVNPALTGFLTDGALRPGHILIPGAGRSPEPRVLADAGFTVVTVDVSPSAVAAQQKLLAGTSGRALLADLFAWRPEQPFDAIYDQACLCALPPALVPDYAARLAQWLRPGGVLVELFLQRDTEGGPPFHCDLARMREVFPDRDWLWPAATQAASPPRLAGYSDIPTALRRR